MIPPRGQVVEFIGQSSVVEVRIVVSVRPPKNGEGLLAGLKDLQSGRRPGSMDPRFSSGSVRGPLTGTSNFDQSRDS